MSEHRADDWIKKSLEKINDVGTLPEVRGQQGTTSPPVSGYPATGLPGIPSASGHQDSQVEAWLTASEGGTSPLEGSRFFHESGVIRDTPEPLSGWDRFSGTSSRGETRLGQLNRQGFNINDFTTQQNFMKLAELGASDHPHADIANSAINYLARETKEVRREELTNTDNKLQAQYNALSGYGYPIPKELSDALLANTASQLALDADKEPIDSNEGLDDAMALKFWGGSLINPETIKLTDTPSTPAEIIAVGMKGLGFFESNDIHMEEAAGGGVRFFKMIDGEDLTLGGKEYVQAFDAWKKYQNGLELVSFQAKEVITSQLGADREMRFEQFKNDFTSRQDTIKSQQAARQGDLNRAIQTGNLEESIRASRASEELTRQTNLMAKQQFAITMMLQIAANPATLFFLRKSGFVNQLATFMGIDPEVFAGPAEGSESTLSAFNMQSWNQLTPQQKKIAMYSMQAETGLSEAEIKQRIQETSPGGFAQITRRTLG
jgi:hypothetical protein